MIKKELYAAPATEVLELRLEGVIAASIDPLNNPTREAIGTSYDGGSEDW